MCFKQKCYNEYVSGKPYLPNKKELTMENQESITLNGKQFEKMNIQLVYAFANGQGGKFYWHR